MNDFNFFSPYLATKKERDQKWIFVTMGGIITCFIVVSLVWNTVNIFILKSKITTLNNSINDASIQEQLRTSEALAKKSESLKKLNTDLNEIYNYINSRSIIKQELMVNISGILPEGVALKTMTADGKTIQIQATSKSRTAIGEFQHNLKQKNEFKDVSISNINSDLAASDAQFTFSIKCVLKDVDNNANK